MFYKYLGMIVWALGKRVARRKVAAVDRRKVAAISLAGLGGIGLAVLLAHKHCTDSDDF